MSNYVYGNPLLLVCWKYCQSWNALGHPDSRAWTLQTSCSFDHQEYCSSLLVYPVIPKKLILGCPMTLQWMSVTVFMYILYCTHCASLFLCGAQQKYSFVLEYALQNQNQRCITKQAQNITVLITPCLCR